MKQQALIQAQLHVLQIKKMAAAATAEAESLEAAAQFFLFFNQRYNE